MLGFSFCVLTTPQVHRVPHTVFHLQKERKLLKYSVYIWHPESWVLLGDNRQLGSANTRELFLPPETHLPNEQLQWVP